MSADDKSGRGDFFAIDRRCWARVCELGLNVAVAYLVQSRGTGRDQRTTGWSAKSVESHTGISRHRATEAVAAVTKAGLTVQEGPATRPSFKLQPAHLIPGCEGYPPAELDHIEEHIRKQIADGNSRPPKRAPWVGGYSGRWGMWETEHPQEVADRLVSKGWAKKAQNGAYLLLSYDAEVAQKPDWIWLPNALIDGAKGDLFSPVELVRQTQDLSLLRLLIHAYHLHHLADNSGIHWRIIRESYERKKIGEHGQFVVYGFRKIAWVAFGVPAFVRPFLTGNLVPVAGTDQTRDSGWDEFFARWHRLTSLGLVQSVPHLIEADTQAGEVIHPLDGDQDEWLVRIAAQEAAERLLTEGQIAAARRDELSLIPVPAHLADAAVVGIARLRYRPRTSATSVWLRKGEAEVYAARYDKIAENMRVSDSAFR